MLTKAILLGTKHRRTVTLTHPETGETYSVTVRPLSDGEAEEIQALNTAGMKVQGDPRRQGGNGMQVIGDIAEVTRNQLRARRKTVALALCGEESWTEEEIASTWPPAWVNQVAAVVNEISGIELETAQVTSFRGVAGGPGVAAADATGDPAGA